MILSRNPVVPVLLILTFAGSPLLAQNAPAATPNQKSPAVSQSAPATTQGNTSSTSTATATVQKPDKAAAYYHYTLAHMYEELVTLYGRTDLTNKAIEEYRLAIQNDPDSDYLNSGLAELYARLNRIRDAVMEAQDIIKRNPNNLDARRLLGRIYLRSLGDMSTGTQSQEMLKLAIEQFEQIVRIDPKSVDDLLLLGRLYILNKDMLKAESVFKKAAQLDPTSEDAYTSLAYLYNEEGNSQKAVELLNSVPDPQRSAKIYAALGYTYEQRHDTKKAIDAYRKAVDLDHDNLDAVRGLAQNLFADDQAEAALEQYQAVIEADPQDAQAQLRIAEIQRHLGQYDKALASLQKAQDLVQDSEEIPYNFALVYAAQGRYDEAIKTLQDLLQKTEKPTGNYTDQESHNRAIFVEKLGSIYRDMGNTQQAVEAYRKMLGMGDESSTRGYQQLIDTYREAKMWDQATAVAREAVAKQPQNRRLKLALAIQLADTGKPDQGITLAKSLLKGDRKEDRETYLGLSQIYMRLKRFAEAEQAVEEAAKLSETQDEKEDVQYLQGSIFERQKKYDAAEEMFRKILTVDPNNAGVLNYLGYMLADRGVRLEEALNLIKKALQQDPQNYAYLDSVGWAYYKLGNYDQAEENLRKAVARQPNDPTLNQHLGDLYQKTGKLKLATAHWERALQEWSKSVPADVDTDEVAKVQKKLESARIKLAREQTEGAKPREK